MWGNQGGFSGYGNQGGSEGGGFMNSPGFNSPQTSAGGEKASAKRARSNNIVPCSVANVVQAENVDGAFKICDGKIELGQVTLIGLVKAVRELPTRIEYEIDDCTGPVLDIRQFSDGGDTDVRVTPFTENTYIRVFGHIRDINEKRMVAAFRVEQVADMNALTTHLLEMIYSRLHYSKAQDENMNNTGGQTLPQQSKTNAGGQGGAGDDFYNGLTHVQSQVHRMIGTSNTEQGVSIQQLTSDCKGLSEKQIRDAIDFLSGEGHIYSTIDDDHFRTTDS